MNHSAELRPAISRTMAVALMGLLTIVLALAFAPVAHAAVYDPLDVISYETWRASSSMNTQDIQAFLETQPGPLKSLVTTDYAGIKKPASRIIWEAANGWNLNPKVILATLQKEQSLLTTSNSSNAARFLKAMGCGVYGIDPVTKKTINRFPGFGKQVWYGASKFSTYEITYKWTPSSTKTVTVSATGKSLTIKPKNASTFALYTYTPYYPQKLVWDIYTRYFGDPHASPRLRPVYRFYNRGTGAYFYTNREATRYDYIRTMQSKYRYDGVAFTIDTSSTVNTATIWRLYNTRNHRYHYTTSTATRDALLRIRPLQWRISGNLGKASTTATGTPVYRLQNRSTKANLLTTSATVKRDLTAGRTPRFVYKGIAFWLGRSVTTTAPVGPAQ